MSGPWEKYGAETPAPWVKYSGQDETNIPRDLAASGGSGLVRGVAFGLDTPAHVGGLLKEGIAWATEKITGEPPSEQYLDALSPKLPLGIDLTRPYATEAATEIAPEVMQYEPKTTGGEYAQTVGEFIPGAAGGGWRALLQTIGAGVGSETAGQLLEGSKFETAGRIGGALLGGVVTDLVSGVPGKIQTASRRREFVENTPTLDALRKQADDLYTAARTEGVVAQADDIAAFRSQVDDLLATEGLKSPKGRIVGDMPAVRGVVDMLDDYADEVMTPEQMLSFKQTINNAAGSANPSEARIGAMLREKYYDFTDPLAPAIREANATYRVLSQGELIEQTIDLAGLKAGQFSGSGFENALRTEFRALARRITKGQLSVSPDEAAIIRRIADGGAIENLARDIGKAAPRGVVSTAATSGVPFAVGTAVQGPELGLLMGGSALGLGEIGRRSATAMQTRNAQLASAIARSGGKMPQHIQDASRGSRGTYLPGLLAAQE